MQVIGKQTTDMLSGCPKDDMAEGDLGDGLGKKPGGLYERKHGVHSGDRTDTSEPVPSSGESGSVSFKWMSTGSQYAALQREMGAQQPCPRPRLADTGPLGELSIVELKKRLQEVSEEAEVLRCELEATQRHLEGKHEALKILQSRAVFDRATTHTKILLQKSEDRTKALEKEVNSLQWEITFNQEQFKNCEQSWQEKSESVSSENKTLRDAVEESAKEVQELRADNASLSQRCLELMSMLSAQEQRAFQRSLPMPCTLRRDDTTLELAVLGACCCSSSAGDPCPCARTAASSRKQVLQLKQELEVQTMRREEAYMVADAFRIAFEQQLKRRSEQVLWLAEKDGCHLREGHKEEASLQRGSFTLAKKLKGMLQSTAEGKISDDLAETLHHLVDLLNDKEEALAHQRKVSYMLARNTEELQQRLSRLTAADLRTCTRTLWPLAGPCEDGDAQVCKPAHVQDPPGTDTADAQSCRPQTPSVITDTLGTDFAGGKEG